MRFLQVALFLLMASFPVLMLGNSVIFVFEHITPNLLMARLPYLLEPLVFTLCTVPLGLALYTWGRCLRRYAVEDMLLALLVTACSVHIIVRVLYRLVLFTVLHTPTVCSLPLP